MVIYEVNLSVDNDIAEEVAAWLPGHIREILALDGFTGASWYYREPDGDRQRWTVHYRLDTYQHLQDYFDHHAARLRQDGLDRFGGRFEADRRVLYTRETF